MSRRCELTGKSPWSAKVSHSNIKTKRRFLPNLRNVTLISDIGAQNPDACISQRLEDRRPSWRARCIPAEANDDELAPRVLELKRQIVKSARPAAADVLSRYFIAHARPRAGHPCLCGTHQNINSPDAVTTGLSPLSKTEAAGCAG